MPLSPAWPDPAPSVDVILRRAEGKTVLPLSSSGAPGQQAAPHRWLARLSVPRRIIIIVIIVAPDSPVHAIGDNAQNARAHLLQLLLCRNGQFPGRPADADHEQAAINK